VQSYGEINMRAIARLWHFCYHTFGILSKKQVIQQVFYKKSLSL